MNPPWRHRFSVVSCGRPFSNLEVDRIKNDSLVVGNWPVTRLASTPCTVGRTMNIMDCMSGKATALFGIIGAAALGIYFKWRRPGRAPSGVLEPKSSFPRPRLIEIDDDAAADIIKRARPALERAYQLYACWL
jgi:hypothetical protein